MRALVAFVRLARLPFLFGGFIGFGLGAVVARYDGFALDVATYCWSQALVTSFHLMVHFSNDFFDRASDALTERTAWSGGSGVLASGALPPRVALIAAAVCGVMGLALTFGAAYHTEYALAGIGIAIALLAWSYSAPPARLLARGLGEATTMVVVAILVPLAGYAAFSGTIGAHVAAATIPGALAIFAMMIAVELPDRVADAATGKRNLVVRFGEAFARRAIFAAAIAATIAFVVIGSTTFQTPAIAASTLVPIVFVAYRFAVPGVLRRPYLRAPVCGIAFYATVACGMFVSVALATP